METPCTLPVLNHPVPQTKRTTAFRAANNSANRTGQKMWLAETQARPTPVGSRFHWLYPADGGEHMVKPTLRMRRRRRPAQCTGIGEVPLASFLVS
jgi:hypothetical protein